MSSKKRKAEKALEAQQAQELADRRKNIIIASVCAGIVAVIAVLVLLIVLLGGNGGKKEDENPKTNQLGTGACEYLETRNTEGRDIKYVEMCVEGYGRVVILLDATTAPITVNNFINLVEKGFYDGLTFHRIMDNFMIQGGDPKGNGTGGNTDANGNEINIKGEFDENGHVNDISHKYGVISMARSSVDNVGNQGRDTASSQFFICNADASASLDGKYAAFGYVVEGMSVIDEMANYSSGFLDTTYDGYDGLIISEYQPRIKYARILDNGWKRP
jgi:peptidyl-prolyl cis-trans isomerase B (cyclophilin B)